MFAWMVLAGLGLLVALALGRNRGRLVGPMLGYQLVLTSRRGKVFATRVLYAGILLGIFLVVFGRHDFTQAPPRFLSFGGGRESTLADQFAARERFVSGIFAVCAVVQYVLLLVLTPAFMAGIIAEEKQRRTFHLLFTTDLSSTEMVFGLFLSRLSLLGMIFLAGLPVVPVLELVSHVDPHLIWGCYVALAITIVSVGAVSALNSVLSNQSTEAILSTYMVIAIYLVLSALAKLLLLPSLSLASFPSTQTWKSPVTIEDVVRLLNSGNLVTTAYDLFGRYHYFGELDLGKEVNSRLYAYYLFHLVVAASCCVLTMLLLRRKALTESTARLHGTQRAGLFQVLLGIWPLFWLECHAGGGGRKHWSSRLLAGCGIALLFWLPIHLCYFFGRVSPDHPTIRMADLLSLWARLAAAFLGTVILIQTALRASSAIIRERAADTLDSLLSVPASNLAILSAKWFGSLCGSRYGWMALAILGGYGLMAGFIHPWGIVFFLAAWLCGAFFLTSLGLWMSIECRNTRGAAFLTLVIAGAAMLGAIFAPNYLEMTGWTQLERQAIVPPVGLFWLLLSPGQFVSFADPTSLQVEHLLVGGGFWVVLSILLFGICLVRFRTRTGRMSDRASGRGKILDFSWIRLSFWRDWLRSAWTEFQVSSFHFQGMFKRSTVYWAPLAAICAVYLALGWRNSRDLRAVIHNLDGTEPGWRSLELGAEKVSLVRKSDIDAERGQEARLARNALSQSLEHALTLARGGKIDASLNTCLTELKSVDAFVEPRVFATVEARLAMQARIYRLIRSCLGAGVASEATLAALSDRIGVEEEFPYATIAMKGARQDYESEMLFLELGHTPQEQSLKLSEEELLLLQQPHARNRLFMPEFGPQTPKAFQWPRSLPAIPNLAELEFLAQQALPRQQCVGLEIANRMIEISALPQGQRLAASEELEIGTKFTSFDTARFTPSLITWELMQAERRTLLAALQIERYRLLHSAWPADLTAVAKEFDQPVPQDPCRTGPLQFREIHDGVCVYSIGFDGVDNGGKLYLEAGFPPGGFDVGVNLVNPSQRKLEMLPAEEEVQKPKRNPFSPFDRD